MPKIFYEMFQFISVLCRCVCVEGEGGMFIGSVKVLYVAYFFNGKRNHYLFMSIQ